MSSVHTARNIYRCLRMPQPDACDLTSFDRPASTRAHSLHHCARDLPIARVAVEFVKLFLPTRAHLVTVTALHSFKHRVGPHVRFSSALKIPSKCVGMCRLPMPCPSTVSLCSHFRIGHAPHAWTWHTHACLASLSVVSSWFHGSLGVMSHTCTYAHTLPRVRTRRPVLRTPVRSPFSILLSLLYKATHTHKHTHHAARQKSGEAHNLSCIFTLAPTP
jgi:hypothetical protein